MWRSGVSSELFLRFYVNECFKPGICGQWQAGIWLGAVVVFLFQGTEAEEILGCFGENGETEGGGKELTFTYMEKKGIFS